MTANYSAVSSGRKVSLSNARAWLGRFWPWLGCAAVLGLYVFLQVHCYRPGHVEPDLDGYTWLAKRIATGAALTVKPADPFRYQSHVWVENARGEVTVKYAPGHPLVMALFYRVFGDEGIFLVSPVAGALALAAMFLLFRLWMRPLAALLAVLVVSLNEQFLFYSGYLLSHMLDVCLITWGMYFLWRWLARPAAGWGIGAGLMLGYAVLVRHTSVVLGHLQRVKAPSRSRYGGLWPCLVLLRPRFFDACGRNAADFREKISRRWASTLQAYPARSRSDVAVCRLENQRADRLLRRSGLSPCGVHNRLLRFAIGACAVASGRPHDDGPGGPDRLLDYVLLQILDHRLDPIIRGFG